MKIVTDDGADLLPEEVEALGIIIAPLFIHFPEGEVDSRKISRDAFYKRLQEVAPQVPTTATPSAGEFAEIYRQAAPEGEEIMSIHITGRLSSTVEAARIGAEQFGDQVTLVDTLSFSGGQRFQVLAAALAAKAGWAKESILKRLDRIREATEIVFTLDTMEYLARGGRVGRLQALIGSLLQIKPVIAVDKQDGRFSPAGRGRTLPKALVMIVDYLLQRYKPDTPLWLAVLHGQFAEQAQKLSQLLREQLQVVKLEVLRISPAIGVHAGPGSVGVASVPANLMEGLW